VLLPGYRVLRAMAPLQPLGQETHRVKETGPRPPRPARMRGKAPSARGAAAPLN
jgi:two-component system cell cycle sensor histidine kinase PleC